MKRFLIATAAAALMLSPTLAVAHGAGGGSMGHSGMMGPSSTTMGSSSTTTTNTQRGPSSTGQPNQSCGSATAPNTPGNAASAPGSAFNPDGKSGTVYAGQQPQNSNNTASVSQYDVACAHQ